MSARDDDDPFELLERSMGTGVVRDPYPTFAEMRQECPVQRGNFGARFGLPLPEVMSSASGEYYSVVSYA
ncbi:MAG TPA: hypothetical protein VGC36_12260, partial [Rhizomicrobium sp.]